MSGELLSSCASDCGVATVAFLMCAHPSLLTSPCPAAVDAFSATGPAWKQAASRTLHSPSPASKHTLRQRLHANGHLSARGNSFCCACVMCHVIVQRRLCLDFVCLTEFPGYPPYSFTQPDVTLTPSDTYNAVVHMLTCGAAVGKHWGCALPTHDPTESNAAIVMEDDGMYDGAAWERAQAMLRCLRDNWREWRTRLLLCPEEANATILHSFPFAVKALHDVLLHAQRYTDHWCRPSHSGFLLFII